MKRPFKKGMYEPMKHARIILLAAIAVSLLTVNASLADLYRYTDKDGKEHIVDDVQMIPPEYRAPFLLDAKEEADKIKKPDIQEMLDKEARAMENARLNQRSVETLAQSADEATEPVRKDSLLVRIIKLGVAIISLACLAVVLIKGGEYLGYKKIGSLAAIAITLVVSGYQFASNLKNVADNYHILKAKTEALTKKLGKRTADGERILKDMEPQQDAGRSDAGTEPQRP